MKERILLRYRLTPSAYRSKFRRETKQANESFVEFAARLDRFFHMWLRPSETLKENAEASAIFDKIVADQFVSTIKDETLRLKLVDKDNLKLRELAQFADNFVLERKLLRDGQSNSQKQDSKKQDFKKQDSKPDSKPTSGVKSNTDSAKFKSGKFNDACYKCGQLGHKRRDCPQKQSAGSSSEKANMLLVKDKVGMPGLNVNAPEFLPRSRKDPFLVESCGPLLEISVSGNKTVGLADSGSGVTLVREAMCSHLLLGEIHKCERKLSWFEGSEVLSKGCIMLEIRCCGETKAVECIVVDQLPAPLLLGRDFIRGIGLTLDFRNQSYWLEGSNPTIKWPMLGMDGDPGSSIDGDTAMLEEPSVETSKVSPPVEATQEEETKLKSLLAEYDDVLSEKPGRTSLIEHVIELSDYTPIAQRPYKLSPAKHAQCKQQIPELMAMDILEQSQSAWRTPVVMVPKPGQNRFRMVQDYRALNSRTKVDAYPMVNLEKILGSLHGAKVFSTLDMKNGFWQIPLRVQDRHLTAFSEGSKLYQYKVMPMGVVNGPATFTRLMDKVLHGYIGKFCCVYQDDIIIYSKTVTEHLHHLRKILQRLREAGLTVNPAKSTFLRASVYFLGHSLSGMGVAAGQDKLAAIRDFATPRNRKELERFMGMVGW